MYISPWGVFGVGTFNIRTHRYLTGGCQLRIVNRILRHNLLLYTIDRVFGLSVSQKRLIFTRGRNMRDASFIYMFRLHFGTPTSYIGLDKGPLITGINYGLNDLSVYFITRKCCGCVTLFTLKRQDFLHLRRGRRPLCTRARTTHQGQVSTSLLCWTIVSSSTTCNTLHTCFI